MNKHKQEKWICDIRVGCVAVYAGEKQNCLSGLSESFIFYKNGKLRKNGWTVLKKDVANAKRIVHCVNNFDELLEACKWAKTYLNKYKDTLYADGHLALGFCEDALAKAEETL